MKFRNVFASILLLILISVINISAQESYDLKYNFEKGKTYYYQLTLNSTINMSVLGKGGDIDIGVKAKLKIETSDVTAETIQLLCTGDSLKIQSSMFDSGNEAGSFKIKLVLNRKGKIIEQTMLEGSPALKSLDFKSSTGMFIRLPESTIKTGDTWTVSDSIKLELIGVGSMKTITDTKFTLEGKEIINGSEYLKISYVQGIKSDTPKNDSSPMKTNSKGTGKGIYYYDYRTGLLISHISSNETAAEMSVSGSDKTLSFSASMKMEMKLVK